jgi:hypothetical protein
MLGTFFSYFVIFFIVARLVSLTSGVKWIRTVKTTTRQDAILAIIFSLIVAATSR